MKRFARTAWYLVLFAAVSALLLPCASYAETPSQALPAAINPSANYLFFFHNYYVETKGPDGDCKYNDILKSFTDRNFTVVSEIRPKDSSVIEYARKATADIRKLLDAGVPAERITVAGHSKGAVIALQVASQLDKPKVNYVFMAGCGIKGLEKAYPDYSRMKGNLLSIYAASDKVAGSCNAALSQAKQAGTAKEIVIDSAAGHQLFFKPSEVWLEPVVAWLKQGK